MGGGLGVGAGGGHDGPTGLTARLGGGPRGVPPFTCECVQDQGRQDIYVLWCRRLVGKVGVHLADRLSSVATYTPR